MPIYIYVNSCAQSRLPRRLGAAAVAEVALSPTKYIRRKSINAFVLETMSSYNPIAKIKEAQEACGIQTFTPAPPGSKNAVVITHYDTTCVRNKLSSK